MYAVNGMVCVNGDTRECMGSFCQLCTLETLVIVKLAAVSVLASSISLGLASHLKMLWLKVSDHKN